MQRTNFKKTRLWCVILLFAFSFTYAQNHEIKDITLTILKDSIENNSLVTIEFFNHSDTNYYLPLDISMDRYLGFNSYYKRGDHFSLKERWYDDQLDVGGFRGTDSTNCSGLDKSLFASDSAKKEKAFTNVDVLLLGSNMSIRMQIPIKFIKHEFYSCLLFYQSTAYLFAYFQLYYQVTNEKMETLRKENEIYNRNKLEDKGYQLYTQKIESNIVPLKISRAMKEFMKDPYYGEAFLEIERE